MFLVYFRSRKNGAILDLFYIKKQDNINASTKIKEYILIV